MHRRLLPLAALTAAAVALLAPLALADNQSVVARNANVFAPAKVAVKPGESVTFTNEGGEHNMVWNDGTPAQPPTAVTPDQWPAGGITRTFTRVGKVRYYCALHGDRTADFGMVGYVYVNPPGLLPPTLSGLTATATRTGVRVRFRSSRAGRAKATFFRRVGRTFRRQWASTFSARQGLTNRRIARTLAMGSYRVEVVVTDANRLASDKRTKTFRVR
jgi:plastocyanin